MTGPFLIMFCTTSFIKINCVQIIYIFDYVPMLLLMAELLENYSRWTCIKNSIKLFRTYPVALLLEIRGSLNAKD